MPRYDYLCPRCRLVIEKTHGMQQSLAYFCPRCSGTQLVRQIPLVPFHLKGYGFYKTDSRPAAEDWEYDHLDGSGDRAEIKARDRRIKNPKDFLR